MNSVPKTGTMLYHSFFFYILPWSFGYREDGKDEKGGKSQTTFGSAQRTTRDVKVQSHSPSNSQKCTFGKRALRTGVTSPTYPPLKVLVPLSHRSFRTPNVDSPVELEGEGKERPLKG